LKEIVKTMKYLEREQRSIRNIEIEEVEGWQGRAVLNRISTRPMLKRNQAVVIFSEENPNPRTGKRSKRDKALKKVYPAHGYLIKRTNKKNLREIGEQGSSLYWDVRMSYHKGSQALETQFLENLYKIPDVEGGWVFKQDLLYNVPDGFSRFAAKPTTSGSLSPTTSGSLSSSSPTTSGSLSSSSPTTRIRPVSIRTMTRTGTTATKGKGKGKGRGRSSVSANPGIMVRPPRGMIMRTRTGIRINPTATKGKGEDSVSSNPTTRVKPVSTRTREGLRAKARATKGKAKGASMSPVSARTREGLRGKTRARA
jgi:hypothetical protein